MSAAKTIEYLPHFRVSEVKANEKNTEFFELTGIFDRTEHVAEGRCSLLPLLADELIALPGYLEFQNQQERTARIHISSEKPPDVTGQWLTNVPAKWDPLHVWMVALPTWRWAKSWFQASDAPAERGKGTEVSIVDSEEIKEWIKIREKGKSTGLSRYYPVFPSGKSRPQIEADGTIKNGWTHVHCALGHGHVESGQFEYLYPSEHWVCEECYRKYVAEYDLSFIFE